MARGILLGIDLGTTVLKICAFDAKTGKTLALVAERLPVIMLKNGGRELSIKSLDRAIARATSAIRSQLGPNTARVEGVGVASQGGSSIIADKTTGNALTSMVLWNDARGFNYLHRVMERFPTAYWRRVALRDFAPAGLCRLLWLKEQYPELFTDKHIHVGAGEYLFFKLTGVWRQEPGHALQIGAFDAKAGRLEKEPFSIVDMPLSFVAPLRNGHETSPLSARGATVLHIPKGIPVAGPYIDQEAGYLSAAAVYPRALQCSLGTAWVGNFVLPTGIAGKSPTQLVLPAASGSGRLVIQPLLTGNAGWDWALKRFLDPNHAVALERATSVFRESLLPPPGLFAIPWFSQQNPLFAGVYGAGMFAGVSAQTSPEDLVRAVAAGMTFEFARTLEQASQANVVDTVVIGGGASKASYFCMLLAGLFAPLSVFKQTDENVTAARGSLHVFGGKAAGGFIRKVTPPNDEIMGGIVRAYEQYKTVFGSYFGSVAIGEPFRITRRTS